MNMNDKVKDFYSKYVYSNYNLFDPTSEDRTISPAADYHEGCFLIVLEYLEDATGDKKIRNFLEKLRKDHEEEYDKDLIDEYNYMGTVGHIECKECGTVIWDEEADFCPSCHNNPKGE